MDSPDWLQFVGIIDGPYQWQSYQAFVASESKGCLPWRLASLEPRPAVMVPSCGVSLLSSEREKPHRYPSGDINMAEYSTEDQMRKKVVAAMGAPLGELYFALYREVVWLHLKWKDFRDLFAINPERVDLLNRAAPDFFANLQRMMFEDVLMHLCRLTDPPQSMGHDNLTLRQLPNSITVQALCSQVQSNVDAAKQKTQFARDWRNRALSHKALPQPTGLQPLAQANLRGVEDALEKIRQTMNCIEQHYQNSIVDYAESVEPSGGVVSLLQHLKKSLET